MDIRITELKDIYDPEFQTFFNEWQSDIEQFFTHFDLEESGLCVVYKLEVEDVMAGVFLYIPKGLEAHIEIDYLIPIYRDLGIGKEFFSQKEAQFKSEGFEKMVSLTDDEAHKNYLLSLGFEKSTKHPHRYSKKLA
ncbi:MAG: GNAT family N-acetyltransferase [Flavobacteriales bacterium]|jgi:GNAT superfamily N-acetyltransferase|nr:GNAT family N-acetyltransferase [Flavobacteriales bacterium]